MGGKEDESSIWVERGVVKAYGQLIGEAGGISVEIGCKWHLDGIGRNGHAYGQLTGDAGDVGHIGRGHVS